MKRRELDALEAEIRGGKQSARGKTASRPKRVMSEAQKEHLRQMQKAFWARKRKEAAKQQKGRKTRKGAKTQPSVAPELPATSI